ncbi:hypothetical protein C5167_009113 [Papaver somniferum]|uniref:DNA-directed RNA polymerase subunit n=1 Tax=Papaver somniferum TaxID=3469 RepID=A0A4Y7K070_PAPSO|nr:hypothetical protein C5167_009113 [Papaver somniferum]
MFTCRVLLGTRLTRPSCTTYFAPLLSGRHGFVVAITGVDNVGKGLIRDGTGFVTFPVKYQCVVFRPFKGEILEAVVTMVNKMGFFAEAGPVQIFVSNHLIPDDMEFQSGDIPNYTTSDGSVKIQKDSEVRLKIIGTRVDATEIPRLLTSNCLRIDEPFPDHLLDWSLSASKRAEYYQPLQRPGLPASLSFVFISSSTRWNLMVVRGQFVLGRFFFWPRDVCQTQSDRFSNGCHLTAAEPTKAALALARSLPQRL